MVLNFSIWDHLVHITKGGNRTVIITTHYIEETRQAHMVRICYLTLYCFLVSTLKVPISFIPRLHSPSSLIFDGYSAFLLKSYPSM